MAAAPTAERREGAWLPRQWAPPLVHCTAAGQVGGGSSVTSAPGGWAGRGAGVAAAEAATRRLGEQGGRQREAETSQTEPPPTHAMSVSAGLLCAVRPGCANEKEWSVAIELAVVAERALISRMCVRYCSEPEDSMPSVHARVIFGLTRTGRSLEVRCTTQMRTGN